MSAVARLIKLDLLLLHKDHLGVLKALEFIKLDKDKDLWIKLGKQEERLPPSKLSPSLRDSTKLYKNIRRDLRLLAEDLSKMTLVSVKARSLTR